MSEPLKRLSTPSDRRFALLLFSLGGALIAAAALAAFAGHWRGGAALAMVPAVVLLVWGNNMWSGTRSEEGDRFIEQLFTFFWC